MGVSFTRLWSSYLYTSLSGEGKTSEILNDLLSFSHSPIGLFSILFSTVHTLHKLSVLSTLILSAGDDDLKYAECLPPNHNEVST